MSTQRVVIPSHTGGIRTVISLPDETYDQATALAKKLGMSRSEFFARAAEKYAIELSASSLTAHINQALETASSDDTAAAAAAAGRRRLAGEDDW